ncbi:MAG: hypothetical protein RL764_2087 [Pseudomonadota bacterium]|jgi:hypothetical protein
MAVAVLPLKQPKTAQQAFGGESDMVKTARALVVLMGVVSLATALGLWFRVDDIMPKIGLAASDLAGGLAGRATVRADIAGLFGGMGIALLLAGLRQSRHWANVALIFVSVAISGRLISLLIDGAAPAIWPPIFIEAAIIAVLFGYRRGLSR